MPLGDTDALVSAIRRHTHIPGTHPDYTDALTLADATEELLAYLLPLGLGTKQELWAGPSGRLRLPLVDGQAAYAISHRAAGGKLRAVRLLGPQGEMAPLNNYGREEVGSVPDSPGTPHGLVVEGATFRLFPTPRGLSGWTLEVDTYVRPAELVLPEVCATISEVTVDGGTTTVRAALTATSDGLAVVGALDVVRATPPFDTQAVAAEVMSVTNLGGGTWEFVLSGALDVMVGDWLCQPGTAPVVQAPLEWHPLLARKVAAKQLASLGDMEGAGAKEPDRTPMEGHAKTLVRPRREDVPRRPANGADRWRR